MSVRLKTSLWVEAFLRQAELHGHYGTVIHKGHEAAGQVFLLFLRDGGLIDVLTPPPGPAFDDEGNRRFELASNEQRSWPDVKMWLDRKRSFDSDLWAVEIEAREGFAGIVPEKK
jgi:hypothetical protein